MNRAFPPFLGCSLLASFLWGRLPVAAYCAVVAPGFILLLYRTCTHGVCFDDAGITIRNFYRTYKLKWHDVRCFTDGQVGILNEGARSYFWAVQIVMHDGRSVNVEATMPWFWGAKSNVPRLLATIEQVTARYQIPAQLTGKKP